MEGLVPATPQRWPSKTSTVLKSRQRSPAGHLVTSGTQAENKQAIHDVNGKLDFLFRFLNKVEFLTFLTSR